MPDDLMTDQLPTSLHAAVCYELRDALRPPYTVASVVTFNALLMAGAWFLLPTAWQDWLFTLHGPSAFAMVLAGWMYADVPATNLLAPDRERVLAAIDEVEITGSDRLEGTGTYVRTIRRVWKGGIGSLDRGIHVDQQ